MTDSLNYSTSSDEDDKFEDASPISINETTICEEIEKITNNQQNLSISNENDCSKEEFVDVNDVEIAETCIDDDKTQLEYEKTLKANKERADTLKVDGNQKFKEELYTEAIEIYTEAIKLCPLSYTAERSILYGNRGATNIQLNAKSAAIDDCTKALQLNKDYMKVLIRRAKLYEDTDKLDESLADYKYIIELDTGYGEGHSAILRLTEKINERNEKLKTEMMGKLKDLGNMILKPFGLSTNNFQMQQDPTTGSYSVNFKNQ